METAAIVFLVLFILLIIIGIIIAIVRGRNAHFYHRQKYLGPQINLSQLSPEERKQVLEMQKSQIQSRETGEFIKNVGSTVSGIFSAFGRRR